MKETGIVRRVDDLGRVVIPKEIRNSMKIREGDPLEFFLQDNMICLGKYCIEDKTELEKHAEFVQRYLGEIVNISFEDNKIRVVFIDGWIGEDIINGDKNFDMNEALYHCMINSGRFKMGNELDEYRRMIAAFGYNEEA